jgi:hypothetical protein
MAHHITINGQTFSSVDDMPPDIRRQYDAAMQFLSKTAGAAPLDQPGHDISISSRADDGTHHTFKTVTKMTTSRFVVNGKEYDRWEDVPLALRAIFKSAGVGPQFPPANDARQFADPKQIADKYQLNYNASSNLSFSLTTLIILLVITLLVGICIGYKLLH